MNEPCSCCARDWGSPWEMGSAAFWIHLTTDANPGTHRLGDTFEQEVVACVLGGAGVPGDISTAAFGRLLHAGLLDGPVPQSSALAQELATPMAVVGRPRPVVYRFHRQRATRIAAVLAWLSDVRATPTLDPRQAVSATEMRDRLLRAPGIGMKTASWIVRNFLDSDEVCIVDIHVARAGVSAGVFCREWRLPHDYPRFEAAFLDWARSGTVRASYLDATIWATLARLGRCGDLLFGEERVSLSAVG